MKTTDPSIFDEAAICIEMYDALVMKTAQHEFIGFDSIAPDENEIYEHEPEEYYLDKFEEKIIMLWRKIKNGIYGKNTERGQIQSPR